MPKTVLVTGATGYVGGELLPKLTERGLDVRALARNPDKADLGVPTYKGDVISGEGLDEALDGVDVAFYLVHSMEGKGGDFAERDRRGARNFGEAAKRNNVGRVIYLGGLEGKSEHLESREEVARILHEYVPDTVHVRAAMVIGANSASFVMLKTLVTRLPAMVTPRWIDTKTQPVAIRDVTRALVELATRDDAPHEVELGGKDVLTYREMMRRMATLSGRRPRPIVKVPVLTPGLSSYWVAFVTPVDATLARSLVEGLSAEMIVRNPPPPGINDDPMSFDDAVRAALG